MQNGVWPVRLSMASLNREKSQVARFSNHYSPHRVHVELLPPMDTMEQDSVILPITAVILCILVFGIICCWCLSQMHHQHTRNPTDVVHQWQVPEGRLYPESVALQRSRTPGFSKFIRNVIELFNGQRLEGDQFAVLIFTAEHKLSRMGRIQFQAPQHATDYVNKNYSYFPRGDLTNYLVARPDNGRHCEEIILDQEYRLWNAYKDHHPTGPRCIILTPGSSHALTVQGRL